ncbi:plasmid stability protein [Branchiibius hedensis]|uniref:Plasmid stability protein n=1 Tax=Branchiibius hedensis TaxID=672460 RepID=A0A2Y8ZMQ5_9MICO|nr:antitoxin [Branchiibius hedensis]PWJ24885.1 plasmid stability protein [Branchiibius hedensis]SSA33701.1 Plasmid stability protein [Branchiibius hedensis]
MAEQILIRNLPEGTKSALRARAQQHGRSLEAEARLILAAAVEASNATMVDLLGTSDADITFDPQRLGLTARSTEL